MKEKLRLAGIRALWTGAQSLLGFYTVGMALTDIDWKLALSVTTTAMIFSVLKSFVVGMPEDFVATVFTDEEMEGIEDDVEQE